MPTIRIRTFNRENLFARHKLSSTSTRPRRPRTVRQQHDAVRYFEQTEKKLTAKPTGSDHCTMHIERALEKTQESIK